MEKSPLVQIIKKTLPAVASIVSNKYLPKNGELSQFWGFFEDKETPLEKAVPLKTRKIKVSAGSGFIIESDGLVLTNRHVVLDARAEYSLILSDSRKFPARIIAQDLIKDIAFLKIEEKNLPFIELGDSSFLELGETVIAIGNSLGEFKNSVSVGVVSGLSRFLTAESIIPSGQSSHLRGLIQTDAAINPGNSGGPLINLEGKAIGINAVSVLGAENIGFALPINNAKKDLEDLKKYGRIRQLFLGIRYLLLNEEIKERNNLPVSYGALVISEDLSGDRAILANSPAKKSGIKEFDIILECQNQKVTPENSLEDIVEKFKIGDQLLMKVLRKGKELMLKINIEEKR